MGPHGSCRSQVGPMLASWTLLSRIVWIGILRMSVVLPADWIIPTKSYQSTPERANQSSLLFLCNIPWPRDPPHPDFFFATTLKRVPDSKVHGSHMGPIWGRKDPGGPHVGPMNFLIWVCIDGDVYRNLVWGIDLIILSCNVIHIRKIYPSLHSDVRHLIDSEHLQNKTDCMNHQ